MKKLLFSLLVVMVLGLSISVNAMDVTLEWDPNEESNLQGYIVYRANLEQNASTAWEEIGTVPAGTETYIDAGVEDGSKPVYYVTAYNTDGIESGPSNIAFPTAQMSGRVILRIKTDGSP